MDMLRERTGTTNERQQGRYFYEAEIHFGF